MREIGTIKDLDKLKKISNVKYFNINIIKIEIVLPAFN
jgi:hypothetical protein